MEKQGGPAPTTIRESILDKKETFSPVKNAIVNYTDNHAIDEIC